MLIIATLILNRCHSGRSAECETEFSLAKSAAVKSKGKKAAGEVYMEHALSLKRSGKNDDVMQWVYAYTIVLHPLTCPKGNIVRAEELLLKAIAKDGQLATACVQNNAEMPLNSCCRRAVTIQSSCS